MTEFWIPSHTPPQLTEASCEIVMATLLEEGVKETAAHTLTVIQEADEVFADYLDRLGFDLNQISAEGFWPERILKLGASLAYFAYRETGYLQTISPDAFETGRLLAELEGIPDAYSTSAHDDLRLLDTVTTVSGAKELGYDEQGGYRQVLTLGAGCTRFYLQQALAA